MLYQICNGAVRFAANTVLENVNFEIRNNENTRAFKNIKKRQLYSS